MARAAVSIRGDRAAAPSLTRPVLAFYYTWYHPGTFCTCTMSDVPRKAYESGNPGTIDRQIKQAWRAGVTGFIASWPGPGNTQDDNLALLLDRVGRFDRATGAHFVTSVYLETDAAGVQGNVPQAIRYLISHYTSNPSFFRWNGRPVIFIWAPLGNGRSLGTWAAIRRQVDPHYHLFWSGEGTDTSLLSVFDGIHLFSAAYWGLLDGSIGSIDAGFRARVSAYASAHHVRRVWAAGVEPGYDDTRVPGRTGTYRVPRRNGATYRQSWQAAIASRPDWVTITTWNEWFEGAMIEPGRTYGSLYLNLTRYYASLWRSTRL